MQVDPETDRETIPKIDCDAPYRLMLDGQGTGIYHAANLQPGSLGEHGHKAHQITVLFGQTVALSTWHSDSGCHQQGHVSGGQCYVVPSEQPHGLAIDRAGELINFYITPTFIATTVPEVTQVHSLNLGNLQIAEDLLIRQLAETVRIDRLKHGTVNKLLVESVINVLTFHLVNCYANTAVKIVGPDKMSKQCLANVKEFVVAESIRDITIADMARVAGYSVVHFSRMFKRRTGQTPGQYLLTYRIDRAKKLLQTTTLPISEVAYQVGFGSHAHFSTQFRQVTGITPQLYRTRIQFP
jgi:AraC family transcriptional regulator